MARPRAADDFAAIRARMKELRRERSLAGDHDKPLVPGFPEGSLPPVTKGLPAPYLRRLLQRARTTGRHG